MDVYEQYITQYNIRWQKHIVKANFVAATIVFCFEIAYYFILSSAGLRVQTSLEYILQYILLPAGIIFSFCIIGWFIVYHSSKSLEVKSLAAILSTVALCATASSVHNIFATTLCSFFIPLAVSVVFGETRITNIVGCFCVVGEIIAMGLATTDLRGNDPYFLFDCLMLFIVFGISWYATLLLMKNEKEKRSEIEKMWHLKNEVTTRKHNQEELRLRLQQHQIIMDQTTDVLFEWDIRKDTLTFSANWRKKFGYNPISNEVSGRLPLSKNIHPEDIPIFLALMEDTAAGKEYSEVEFRIKDSQGYFSWCRIRATAQFDDKGHAVKAVGVILDINAEKKEKQKLLKLAQRDSQTGIYNKAATNILVAQQMGKYDSTVLQALIIVDIDFFKSVNDTYGHMVGDSVILAVATQLRSQIRSSDVAGRIGGDEFLVYLSEVESKEAALKKAQLLHASLGLLSPIPNVPHITCSMGLAVFAHNTIEYSDLYRCADAALYLRKEQGRNGVTLYEEH